MAENLLRPDSTGNMPGGTTAAENLTQTATPGAGRLGNTPITGGNTPGNPSETDPGETGQIPTGSKAVPDAAVMENSDTIGDNDSMDDSSSLRGDHSPGNQGAQPSTPGDTSTEAEPAPTISERGAGRSDDGGIPTGGLTGTGTTGGTPTGGVDQGSNASH